MARNTLLTETSGVMAAGVAFLHRWSARRAGTRALARSTPATRDDLGLTLADMARLAA